MLKEMETASQGAGQWQGCACDNRARLFWHRDVLGHLEDPDSGGKNGIVQQKLKTFIRRGNGREWVNETPLCDTPVSKRVFPWHPCGVFPWHPCGRFWLFMNEKSDFNSVSHLSVPNSISVPCPQPHVLLLVQGMAPREEQELPARAWDEHHKSQNVWW